MSILLLALLIGIAVIIISPKIQDDGVTDVDNYIKDAIEDSERTFD